MEKVREDNNRVVRLDQHRDGYDLRSKLPDSSEEGSLRPSLHQNPASAARGVIISVGIGIVLWIPVIWYIVWARG